MKIHPVHVFRCKTLAQSSSACPEGFQDTIGYGTDSAVNRLFTDLSGALKAALPQIKVFILEHQLFAESTP